MSLPESLNYLRNMSDSKVRSVLDQLGYSHTLAKPSDGPLHFQIVKQTGQTKQVPVASVECSSIERGEGVVYIQGRRERAFVREHADFFPPSFTVFVPISESACHPLDQIHIGLTVWPAHIPNTHLNSGGLAFRPFFTVGGLHNGKYFTL